MDKSEIKKLIHLYIKENLRIEIDTFGDQLEIWAYLGEEVISHSLSSPMEK